MTVRGSFHGFFGCSWMFASFTNTQIRPLRMTFLLKKFMYVRQETSLGILLFFTFSPAVNFDKK
jgi:hypothetical protein